MRYRFILFTLFMLLTPDAAIAQLAPNSSAMVPPSSSPQVPPMEGKREEPAIAEDAKPAGDVVESDPVVIKSEAPKRDQRKVSLLYTSPGCFNSGSTHMNLTRHLDAVLEPGASFSFGAITIGGLQAGAQTLLPDPFTDWQAPAELLTKFKDARREIVEKDIPVLVTPWETLVQYPFHNAPDYVAKIEEEERRRRPGLQMERRRADLWRFTFGKRSALMLVEQGTSSVPTSLNALDWVQLPAFVTNIARLDQPVTLYSVGKRHGTPARQKAELARLVGAVEHRPHIMLHPGGALMPAVPGQVDLCGKSLKEIGVEVIGLRRNELALGPEKLAAFASSSNIPFIATNLLVATSKKPPFQRFKIFERNGLKVAVLSVVGPTLLETLPEKTRGEWEVLPVGTAVDAALEGIRATLGRPADLVVMLLAARGEAARLAGNAEGVDVIFGPFNRWGDHVSRRERIDILPRRGGREGAVASGPLLQVHAGPYGVGSVQALFHVDGFPRLDAITHEHRATVHDGPQDLVWARSREALLRSFIATGAQTVLPGLDAFVDVDGVKEMIFGDRILTHMNYRRRDTAGGARFSDALWMRIVTNIMREEMGASVAIALNLERGDDVTGPLPRIVVQSWLPTLPIVQRLKLSGKQLLALSAAIRLHRASDPLPRHHVFTSGIDMKRARIAGRSIDPRQKYDVVITDTLRNIVGLNEILK